MHDGVAVVGWSLAVGDGAKGNTDADAPEMGHPPVSPPTAANLCCLLLDKKVVHRVYIADAEFLVVGEIKQAHEHDRNRQVLGHLGIDLGRHICASGRRSEHGTSQAV